MQSIEINYQVITGMCTKLLKCLMYHDPRRGQDNKTHTYVRTRLSRTLNIVT